MTRLSSVVVSWLGARWRSEGSEMDEWHVCQSGSFRYNIDKSPNCGIAELDIICEIRGRRLHVSSPVAFCCIELYQIRVIFFE